jgi:hypothetical protein
VRSVGLPQVLHCLSFRQRLDQGIEERPASFIFRRRFTIDTVEEERSEAVSRIILQRQGVTIFFDKQLGWSRKPEPGRLLSSRIPPYGLRRFSLRRRQRTMF